MPTVITITDEDGFETTWPWPDDALMLGNGDFVSIFERQHDALRRERGLSRQSVVDGARPAVCPICGRQAMVGPEGPCDACGADTDDIQEAEPRWWEDRD